MTQRNMTSHARRSPAHLLGLLASLALLAGLLVPMPAAEATVPSVVPAAVFGKPTSVNASKISGSNGLKVSWKAPTGGPAAYKVSWGKSSSSAKASYATYVTATSAILSASGMATSTYYYVWVQPWSEAASTGTATGAISSSDKVKTSSFAYRAPAVVRVANVTRTTAEITWRTVTGSPGYVIRAYNATTKKYKYQIGFDGSTVFTGLTPNTSYKFTIANRLLTPDYEVVPGVRMSGWSSSSATKTTGSTQVTIPGDPTPLPVRDAPTDLKLVDRDSSSISLSWTPPAGYDPDKDTFRVYWAENQEMTDNDGYTKPDLTGTSGKVTGLDPNTNYYVRIRMVRLVGSTVLGISDRTTAIMAKTRSPKGFLSGKITGEAGNVLSDYQAIAFAKTSSNTPGDVNAVANVSSSGAYKLEVRPGTYFVKVAYVGSGNHTSQWMTSDGSDAYASQDASVAAVKVDATTTVTSITVGAGATITGKVTDSSTENAIPNVYVSARTNWTAKAEVVGQVTTISDSLVGPLGSYTLTGLPPGKTVLIRVVDSAKNHSTKDVSVTTPAAGANTTLNITMSPS